MRRASSTPFAQRVGLYRPKTPIATIQMAVPRSQGAESEDTSGRAETGFKLGGPFEKDRSFYFLAYEHQRSDEVTPYTGVDRSGVAGGWVVAPSRDDNLFLRTDFNGTADECHAVAIAGPDLVLTAGAVSPGGFPADFGLARYIATIPVELRTFTVE